MIAQAQVKLLACTSNTGKDKEDGREFTWYKYDLLAPKTGVISFTGSHDCSTLVEKEVLVTFDVKSKTEVKLISIEQFDIPVVE